MKEELYRRLRDDIEASAEEVGAEVNYVGEMSNGDERPVIYFDGSRFDEHFIVAGEDENEIESISAVPEIIKDIGEISSEASVNVLPFFDIYSLEEHLGVEHSITNYEELRGMLSPGAIRVGNDELRELIKDNYKNKTKGSERESKKYAAILASVEEVEEIIIDPSSGVLAFKGIDKPSFAQISAGVEALYDDIPKEFYIPIFGKRTLKKYLKKEANFEDRNFLWRPFYGCFDLDPLPEELNPLKEIAEASKSILSMHSYGGEEFFLFSRNAPKGLSDRMVERVRLNDIPIKLGEDLEKIDYLGKISTRDGVVECKRGRKTNLRNYAKEYAISLEVPEAEGETTAKVATQEYISYIGHR